MAGEVDVEESSAPHFKGHEDGQDAERRGDRHEGVAGDEGVGVVPVDLAKRLSEAGNLIQIVE